MNRVRSKDGQPNIDRRVKEGRKKGMKEGRKEGRKESMNAL